MSGNNGEKISRMTDEAWIGATERVRDAVERYDDLDFGRLAAEGADAYCREQDAQRKPNGVRLRISGPFLKLFLAFGLYVALLASFMASSVFLGWFIGGNTVSAMFAEHGSADEYRWPISAAYGVLANVNVSDGAREAAGLSGGMLGAGLMAVAWGLLYVLVHSIMCRFFYGRPVAAMKRYLLRTWAWNSLFALSFGIAGYTHFMSDVRGNSVFGGSGPGLEGYIIPSFVFLFVMWRQHRLNKALVG